MPEVNIPFYHCPYTLFLDSAYPARSFGVIKLVPLPACPAGMCPALPSNSDGIEVLPGHQISSELCRINLRGAWKRSNGNKPFRTDWQGREGGEECSHAVCRGAGVNIGRKRQRCVTTLFCTMSFSLFLPMFLPSF